MKSADGKKIVTGTAIFSRGERILTQVPTYQGEPHGEAYFRAKEHLEMLDRDALIYLPHATRKDIPLNS